MQITIHYNKHVPVAGQKATSTKQLYNIIMFEVQPYRYYIDLGETFCGNVV